MNQNTLPEPSVLLTPAVPPMISAIFLVMAGPSPVPPYLRVVELSACSKAPKDGDRLRGDADTGVLDLEADGDAVVALCDLPGPSG